MSSRLKGAGNLRLVLGLSAAAVAILLAAVIGAIVVGGDDDDGEDGDVAIAGTTTTPELAPGLTPGLNLPAEGGPSTVPSAGGDGGAAPAPGSGGGDQPATGGQGAGGGDTGTTPGAATTAAPTQSAGNRTGVTKSSFNFGVHAPVTLDGAPLPVADDAIKGIRGYVQYVNEQGGINGRKVNLDLQDDRYTVSGGRTAAQTLVNDHQNFFISGTLGVDQIAVVAAEAKKRGVPYMAAGGSEAAFKNIGMFQIASSYDTHAIKLAQWMAKEPSLKDKKKIGVSYLDSPYISPVVGVFERELNKHGFELVAKQAVQKPTEQTSYVQQITAFKGAGVEVFVPLQDPVTTGRQVAECQAQLCTWTYTFSDFAHTGDTTLTLMAGKWGDLKVRGLAGGCYYVGAEVNDPAKCGSMGKAHKGWAAVYGEADWQENGGDGAAAYNVVYFWQKALKDAGADLTRERLVAGLKSYEGYADLVSGPITFKGSTNLSHGAEKMAIFEAQTNRKYKMISPGMLDSF